MNWSALVKGFQEYIILEKGLSDNTVNAYVRDIEKLASHDQHAWGGKGPLNITQEDLEQFISQLYDIGIQAKSQARIISGIKAFYKYVVLEDLAIKSPAQLIEGPKLSRKLPDTLSYEEIQLILDSMDMSMPLAHRNKAIIETLYACGLRVSELTGLKISGIYEDQGFIRVIGKNEKERIIPIAPAALKQIDIYRNSERKLLPIKEGHQDILFLNRRGKQLTRVMIFIMVKNLVAAAGIQKKVSPHTFRHSFASHMVEGGADLRAVQEMLGHESILTTEIYTHTDTNYLRETLMLYHPGIKRK